MSEIVTTVLSYFEFVADYAEPDLQLAFNRAAVVQAIFSAFRRWDITVDDIEVLQTGKPSEQGVRFKLPGKKASFFFGPASCKFSRDDTDWSLAEETIEILHAALAALINAGGVSIASQKTAIALHLQPKILKFSEILRPLIPSSLANLESEPAKTMAVVVKWDDRRVTIDGSGHVANGLFLRLEREFKGNTAYEEIAEKLKADEEAVFQMLGVKEEKQ